MRILSLICLILHVATSAQNSVTGTFIPAENFSYALLYKATPEGAEYIDRGSLDRNGSFSIALNDTVSPGIYKIVYALPPEENNFDFIYNGKENIDFEFSTKDGVIFKDSNENKLWSSYLRSIAMVNQTISNYYAQEHIDEAAFNAIFKTLSDTQNAYEESAKDLLVSNFIVANRPYIPESFEDLSTYSMNVKENYLKHIDYDNYILQCSSFLKEHVLSYVFDMVSNASNDTYKNLVNDVVQSMEHSNLVIRTNLLAQLWQRFAEINKANLANYVTDLYLLDLATSLNMTYLKERILAYKNTSVGAKAPNFEVSLNDNKTTLHNLNAKDYYLLIFWSSSCGHCLGELPEVKKVVESIANIQVIAFALEDDDEGWSKEKINYPNFTHVLGLGKWENEVVKRYDISATPTYFILNSDKKIIGKPYDFKDLAEALDQLQKENTQKN
ncbi:MAG: TlpA family protein disulfide reductase [Winogradskyella sp.]|nr:TlpA family protein disulfide reductase [Winogradskyella sp.]